MNVPRRASPVRSVGCKLIAHAVGLPNKLLPSELIEPSQSVSKGPPGEGLVFFARILFCMLAAPTPAIPPTGRPGGAVCPVSYDRAADHVQGTRVYDCPTISRMVVGNRTVYDHQISV